MRHAKLKIMISLTMLALPLCAQPANKERDGFESAFKVYLSGTDPVKTAAAAEEIKRLSETGNPLAQFYYGHLLVRTSEGNSETAERLFAKSYPKIAELARDGDATAAYMVTYSYKYGYATPLNKRKAFNLRLQLAEKNYSPAAYGVGMSYLDGDGVKTDGDKAAYWLARAAQGGVALAAVTLGEAYRVGQAVSQNYQLAHYWYSVAASAGDRYAARMREEVKPQLSRRDMLESYRMLTKGDSAHYPAGDYTLWQRALMAAGIIFPWFKFVLLDEYMWWDAAAFGLASLLLTWAMFTWRRRRFIADIPVIPIKDVFIGWVHIKGAIDCQTPLTSPLGRERCVYYSWAVSEDWERTVLEEYIDEKGKKQIREKKESGSTVIASGGKRTPFNLTDETGSVDVQLSGAEFDTVSSFNHACGPDDPLYFSFTDAPEIENTTHRRTFSESVLPDAADATIFGQASPLHEGDYLLELGRRLREMGVKATGRAGSLFKIAQDDAAPFYLLSLSNAEQQKSSHSGTIWTLTVISLISVLAFPVARIFFMQDKPGLAGFTLMCGVFYGLIFFLFWFWMSFNGLVYLRNRTAQIWGLIDVQLKRRYELITSLSAAAAGYLAYAGQIQQAVARLRGRNLLAGGKENSAVALLEAYPELGAESVIKDLMDRITETEDRVAGARSAWLNAAAAYNTRLERLPDRLLLRLGLFRRAPLEKTAL